jgi:S-formylglutathione hydrolase FrmB
MNLPPFGKTTLIIIAILISSGCTTQEGWASRHGLREFNAEELKKYDDASITWIIKEYGRWCPDYRASTLHAAEQELKARYPEYADKALSGKIAIGMPEELALLAWPHGQEPNNSWITASGTRKQFAYKYWDQGIPFTYKWFVSKNGKVTMFEQSKY